MTPSAPAFELSELADANAEEPGDLRESQTQPLQVAFQHVAEQIMVRAPWAGGPARAT